LPAEDLNKTANDVGLLCDAESILCEGVQVLGYARERNFFLSQLKSAAFPGPIFMKFTNGQGHYVQISFTEFHVDRATNAVRNYKNSYAPVSKVWISPRRFSGNLDIQYIFVDIVFIEFYPNGMKSAKNADKFEALK
jgi:hypothetical protein